MTGHERSLDGVVTPDRSLFFYVILNTDEPRQPEIAPQEGDKVLTTLCFCHVAVLHQTDSRLGLPRSVECSRNGTKSDIGSLGEGGQAKDHNEVGQLIADEKCKS